MRRREFITLMGGATAWPFAARAQQAAMPVVGFLNPTSPNTFADRLRAFQLGLKESGYVEGENVTIAYRWAENQNDRLPALAADLVRRQVAVIATTGGPTAALVAKTASATTPIVFSVSEDPVKLGLVGSLARPGGNVTGVNILIGELMAKRLELLRELVPTAVRIAALVNPSNATETETTLRDLAVAARAMGLQIHVVNASTSREINLAFATFVHERPDALFVAPGLFFVQKRVQLTHLASRYAIPAAYSVREFAEIGGLMSYGTNVADAYRQVGVYVGRILKGAKPTDLPVVQASKFELVINVETARMLGLDVPPSLLARADEVIE
jgi:putative ABC transport system substrate-binding protein